MKIVVKPELPQDELWCHPEMFNKLQQLIFEYESTKPFRDDTRKTFAETHSPRETK